MGAQMPGEPQLYGMPPPPTEPRVDTRPFELRGVRMARWASLASLIGLIVLIVLPLVIIITLGAHLPFLGSVFGTAALTLVAVEEIIGALAAGAALTLISMILYVVAFWSMTKVQKGFGGPMGLTIVGILGMLLITVGVVLILVTILQAVGCVASGAAASCVSLSQLEGGVLAVFGGALLALIGWIGLLIGVYRIGSRYRSTLTRVGAILYILPFVSILGPILVFIGIHGILKSLEPGGPAPA
jgi:hypothetical protein